MEKIDGKSFNVVEENISKLKEIFPEVFTEDNQINFDKFKSILDINTDVIDGSEEYYNFTWWGKKKAINDAQKSIHKTLRPYKKESKNWDSTENIYIEGDNLDALKLLLGFYRNTIKMIYIENPITFFENVETLIKKMWRYVEERQDEDQGLLFFKTPALAPNTNEPALLRKRWTP